jgi:hypothetical protein
MGSFIVFSLLVLLIGTLINFIVIQKFIGSPSKIGFAIYIVLLCGWTIHHYSWYLYWMSPEFHPFAAYMYGKSFLGTTFTVIFFWLHMTRRRKPSYNISAAMTALKTP